MGVHHLGPERPEEARLVPVVLGALAPLVPLVVRAAGAGVPGWVVAALAVAGLVLGAVTGRRLADGGYRTEDMSDNETAKLHVRHMVGGRTIGLPHERLLRFEFPERPGAFLRFLNSLQPAWALTLFHYRNHGDDVGRVLAGVSIAPDQVAALWTALDALGYPYVDETDNPACRLFLDGAA